MQPPAGARNPTPARRRTWLAVAGVVVLAAVAGSWMLGGADRPQPRRAAPLSAGLVERPVEDTPGAATIIEESGPAMAGMPSPAAADTPTGEGAAVDAGNAPAGDAVAMVAADNSASPADAAPMLSESNPFASTTAAASTSAAPARPRARLAPASSKPKSDEPDLLAVLLGNIRTSEGKARDTEGLDALIQSMQVEEGRTASAGRASSSEAPTDQANGRPLRTRSEQIQSNLRECPPPNTAKGIKCRQDICAVYAGRDPACPAAG